MITNKAALEKVLEGLYNYNDNIIYKCDEYKVVLLDNNTYGVIGRLHRGIANITTSYTKLLPKARTLLENYGVIVNNNINIIYLYKKQGSQIVYVKGISRFIIMPELVYNLNAVHGTVIRKDFYGNIKRNPIREIHSIFKKYKYTEDIYYWNDKKDPIVEDNVNKLYNDDIVKLVYGEYYHRKIDKMSIPQLYGYMRYIQHKINRSPELSGRDFIWSDKMREGVHLIDGLPEELGRALGGKISEAIGIDICCGDVAAIMTYTKNIDQLIEKLIWNKGMSHLCDIVIHDIFTKATK